MGRDLLISAPRLIPADGPPGQPAVLEPGWVTLAAGRITGVGAGRPPRPPDQALDHGVLVPGLVDLQVNGYFGVDLQTASAAGWATVARRLPETGTTAFLPTLITAPLPDLAEALRSAAGYVGLLPAGGARVLGLHLEGPFIAPGRRGAHNEAAIIPPFPASVDTLTEAAGGRLAVVTLAPEVPGGLAAVARLAAAGVLVSVGHSDATADQVRAAADAGARMVTHLFNGQRPLAHREPGVVGQALADPRLTSGLIADLRHVSAVACLVAFQAAPGRICLVTDAAACAGMPPGRYRLGGELIELQDGYPLGLPDGTELAGYAAAPPEPARPGLAGRLPGALEALAGPGRSGSGPGPAVPAGGFPAPVRPDGTLAGSALRLDAAVANLVAAGAPVAAAVAAASRIPADLIGRPDLGRITPGAAADLVWLDDGLRVQATWLAGRQVHPA